MARDLAHRVLLITGASSGIGAAVAEQAATQRMKLVLVARRADRLEAVAEKVRCAGGEAVVAPADVAEPQQVHDAVARGVEAFGQIDALLAGAGYGFFRPALEVSEPDQWRMMQVNHFGSVHTAAAVEPHMRRAGRGHMVFISSIAGKCGLPYYAPYAATKAAQSAWARSLKLELEPAGIDVSVVYPIGTRTEFFEVSAKMSGGSEPLANTPSWMVQSPSRVARSIIRCLRRPRGEVWPSRMGHLMATLWTASPWFYDKVFRRHARLARQARTPSGH